MMIARRGFSISASTLLVMTEERLEWLAAVYCVSAATFHIMFCILFSSGSARTVSEGLHKGTRERERGRVSFYIGTYRSLGPVEADYSAPVKGSEKYDTCSRNVVSMILSAIMPEVEIECPDSACCRWNDGMIGQPDEHAEWRRAYRSLDERL